VVVVVVEIMTAADDGDDCQSNDFEEELLLVPASPAFSPSLCICLFICPLFPFLLLRHSYLWGCRSRFKHFQHMSGHDRRKVDIR